MRKLREVTTLMRDRGVVAYRAYIGEDADGFRVERFEDYMEPVWVLSRRGRVVYVHRERRFVEEAASTYRRRREDQDGSGA